MTIVWFFLGYFVAGFALATVIDRHESRGTTDVMDRGFMSVCFAFIWPVALVIIAGAAVCTMLGYLLTWINDR